MTDLTRRQTLTGLAIAALPWNASVNAGATSRQPHIATNTYPWLTFARRDGGELTLHTPELLGRIASTGISGYEPIIDDASEFDGLAARLKQHQLQMRSIYVNSVLHDPTQVQQSIAGVLQIARAAKDCGVSIIVTNPSPIRWGGSEDKSDAQLRLQARSLDTLGAQLRKLGLTLAYHNHDAELRQGGREFHHMLTATDPAHVKFCLDAHWVYRGCGNSEVAVFDALSHYHDRIVELHLRQSMGGVWTETFSMYGDINYSRLFEFLAAASIAPHLVLEQAVEKETPNTMGVVAAHRQSHTSVQSAVK
ncbi:MAG: sugar phosphate isomerase/epimerase [Planctomycetaceae bacterium]|nr:sugar phosphate isomerase/epimerase [Planctomycetaceae bacterium]